MMAEELDPIEAGKQAAADKKLGAPLRQLNLGAKAGHVKLAGLLYAVHLQQSVRCAQKRQRERDDRRWPLCACH